MTTEEKMERLIAGIKAVADLIDESEAVVGLHYNGDVSTWGDLRTGGQFQDWLMDFDTALKIAEDSE